MFPNGGTGVEVGKGAVTVSKGNLAKSNNWPDRLALDMALLIEKSSKMEDEEVSITAIEMFESYGLTPKDVEKLDKDPVFSQKVGAYRKDIQTNGLSFQIKAQAHADEVLGTAYVMARDENVPAAVRAKMIESLVDWAGYSKKGGGSVTTGNAVQIIINAPDVK